MNDPNRDELISAYLDGELSVEEQARVEQMLSESAELRRWCDEMAAMSSRLQALPRKRLGTNFAASIAARAQQALEDQEAAASPAAAAPIAPAAKPLPAALPKIDEPEVAPERWPFANMSPRMAFWPLAALAAGIAIMIFVPQQEPIPVAVNGETDRKAAEVRGSTFFSDSDFDGLAENRQSGLTYNVPVDRPVGELADAQEGLKRSGGNDDVAVKAGVVSRGTLESDRIEIESLNDGIEDGRRKAGSKIALDEFSMQNGDLVVVVTVPADKWQEETSVRALATQKIELADGEKVTHEYESKGIEGLEHFGAKLDSTFYEARDQRVEKLKALVQTWRESPPKNSQSQWYVVAATPESLDAMFRGFQANGSRVAVLDGTSEDKKEDGAVDLASLHRRLDRLSRRSNLGLQLESDGAEFAKEKAAETMGDRPDSGIGDSPPPPLTTAGASNPKPNGVVARDPVPAAIAPGPSASPSPLPAVPAPVTSPAPVELKLVDKLEATNKPEPKSEPRPAETKSPGKKPSIDNFNDKPGENPEPKPRDFSKNTPSGQSERKPQADPSNKSPEAPLNVRGANPVGGPAAKPQSNSESLPEDSLGPISDLTSRTKAAKKLQPKTGDDIAQRTADGEEYESLYANSGGFNGRAIRLRSLKDLEDRYAYSLPIGGERRSEALGEQGHGSGGGGVAGARPAPLPALPAPADPRPITPKFLAPLEPMEETIAGKKELGAETTRIEPIDVVREKQVKDEKAKESLSKLRQRPVRVVVVFRRGPASVVQPATSATPSAERAVPESKK